MPFVRSPLIFSLVVALGFAEPVRADPAPGTSREPLDALRAAFGIDALDAAPRFSYRLVVKDDDGTVGSDARYVLDTGSGAVSRVADQATAWHDGANGYALGERGVTALSAEDEARLRGHASTNFARLLRDSRTRVTPAGDAWRIAPANDDAFTIVRDASTGLIRENRFDAGIVVSELDYRRVDGLWWPMRFEVRENGQRIRVGEFSEARLSGDALPAIDIRPATTVVLDAPAQGAALLAPKLVSSTANDYNLNVDRAGRTLVFARSEAEFRDAKIFIAHRDEAASPWRQPRAIAFSDARYSDSDPWLTPDGRTLYFVSNRPRPGEKGDAARADLDIWRVALDRGRVAMPEHLGPRINSDAIELGPELHDGKLYFNSTRKGGPAALSIYAATLAGEDRPQPLPGAINAGRMQGDFTLSADGRIAAFWSERDGHDADLYVGTKHGDTWSDARRLPAPYSSIGFDFTPQFAADGRTLHFSSMRRTSLEQRGEPVLNGLSNVYAAAIPALDAATTKTP